MEAGTLRASPVIPKPQAEESSRWIVLSGRLWWGLNTQQKWARQRRAPTLVVVGGPAAPPLRLTLESPDARIAQIPDP